MSKYIDSTHSVTGDIFHGSVETYNCPPSERCNKCGGSGRCTHCAGQGETRCTSCGGRGEIRCTSCGGGGICRSCGGRGGRQENNEWRVCVSCNGSGACSTCHGSGTTRCYSCNGQGYNRCNYCNGSGNCSNCGGSGEITCSRCKGTGYFQTYLRHVANYYTRQYCYPGPTPEFEDGLRLATGDEVCNYVSKYWKKADELQFDHTDKSYKKLAETSGEYSDHIETFKAQFEAAEEMHEPIDGYKPYMNTVRATKVPGTRVKFIVNDTEYEMVFLGNGGVVCHKELPTSLKVFEQSEEERKEMNENAYKRHSAMATLTAYIMNLDSSDKPDTRLINLILKHMGLSAIDRSLKIHSLKLRYPAKQPHDFILDRVSCLLTSKKTICYAWLCMALNKQITPAEEEFFNALVARYNISNSELQSLKKFAGKFMTLDDEQIIKEFLDSEPVFRSYYYNWGIFVTIAFSISILITMISANFTKLAICLGIGYLLYRAIFIRYAFSKFDQTEVDELFMEVSEEEDFTEEDYDDLSFQQKVHYSTLKIYGSIGAIFGFLFDKLIILIKNIIKSE